jgi:pimeloyl-ACP methyl ester carboxylesterase
MNTAVPVIINFMQTFILIHGSWHSAWNWHQVVPLLEQAGHRAIAVDLPGMGRDKTPVETVTLQTAVQKICDLIDGIDGKVILVGHSKNGIVISQVAEYRHQKIEKLIYLAAYLVPDGKTQREYSLQDKEGILKPFVQLHEEKKTTTLSHEIFREGLYADCPDYITEQAKYILSEEPFVSGITPLQLTDACYGSVRRFYIECTEDRAVGPEIQRKMYTEMPCEKVYSLSASHSPFFSKPEELTEIFLKIAFQ